MRRKNNPGCRCCAPPGRCFAKCSDWYIDLADATITDAKGTWYYQAGGRLQPTGLSSCPTFPSASTWKGDFASCPGVAGDAVYGYSLRCDRSGKLGLNQRFPWFACVSAAFPNLYLDKVLCGWPLAINWGGTPDYQTPMIASGVISATFTIPAGDAGLPAGLSVPVPGTAVFSAPIWDPTTDLYECCSPCPVPKKTLTATIKKSGDTASVSLAYSGNGLWAWSGVLFGTNSVVEVECSPFGLRGEIGPCLLSGINTYNCRPFHVGFNLIGSEFGCNLIDKGFTLFTVDE